MFSVLMTMVFFFQGGGIVVYLFQTFYHVSESVCRCNQQSFICCLCFRCAYLSSLYRYLSIFVNIFLFESVCLSFYSIINQTFFLPPPSHFFSMSISFLISRFLYQQLLYPNICFQRYLILSPQHKSCSLSARGCGFQFVICQQILTSS